MAEPLGFIEGEAIDHLELDEGAGALDSDAAEGRGSEDEELGESETLGFGGSPGSEAGIEELLVGGEELCSGCLRAVCGGPSCLEIGCIGLLLGIVAVRTEHSALSTARWALRSR